MTFKNIIQIGNSQPAFFGILIIRLSVLLGVVVFPFNTCELLAKTIEVKKAIQMIKAKENTFHSVSWKCITNKYQSDQAGNLVPANEPPLPCHATVFIDFQKHYRIATKITLPKMKDVLDTEYSQILTYDGKTYRLEKTHYAPNKSPRIDGYIFQENMNKLAEVNWNLYPEGIGFFYPYFGWPLSALEGKTKKLSEYLEYVLSLKRSVTVEEDENGVWLINAQDYIDPQDNFVVYVQIEYDLGKGKSGAIISARKCSPETLSDRDAGPKISYQLQEIDGHFVPKTVKQEQLMGPGKPSRFIILEYDDVKVNVPLHKDDFVIDWQKNTAMVDYIAGQNYLVSDEPIDEAQAVRHFMSLEGLSKPQSIQSNSALYFRIVLVILGLSLIAYGLYSRFKKKNAS